MLRPSSPGRSHFHGVVLILARCPRTRIEDAIRKSGDWHTQGRALPCDKAEERSELGQCELFGASVGAQRGGF